jgi:hypothetical protein
MSISLVGQVAIIKVTGEKCFILEENMPGNYNVRRPIITEKGNIIHVEDTFRQEELETLEEHADRQISEGVIKLKAQKRMALIEQEALLEFEAEQIDNDKQETPNDVLAPFDEPVESKREVTIMRPKAKKVLN